MTKFIDYPCLFLKREFPKPTNRFMTAERHWLVSLMVRLAVKETMPVLASSLAYGRVKSIVP